MIHPNPVQLALIDQLNNGQCHSGNSLGQALKLSRTAIWKQMHRLIQLGLPIVRSHRGYQLQRPFVMLNENELKKQLQTGDCSSEIKLHLFSSLDSSNRYLKDLPATDSIELCCTETQTQGRGRFGRHWHSPFAENIYCSIRWQLKPDFSKLSALSLVSSLAIVETLNDLGIKEEILIKWPNDLLWQDKKLCGSLIEVVAENNGNAIVIIGIGLNVNSLTKNNPLPDKPWCSLYEITGQIHDRNLLIAQIVLRLNQYLQKCLREGFASFASQWRQYDYLANKVITVSQPFGTLSGIAKGVTDEGHLILEEQGGIRHILSSGDTSLSYQARTE